MEQSSITGTLTCMASPAVPSDVPRARGATDGAPRVGFGRPARPTQQVRRERILDVAVELASAGGYDAVQMREVAERAGVALGTLYRYFPSKVHLLVAAMAREIEGIKVPTTGRVASASPPDRVLAVLTRATKAFQRNRNLAGALVRAVMFADASAASEVDRVTRLMDGIIVRTMRGDSDPPTARETAIAGLIEKVWFASQISWVSGRVSDQQVVDDLELAVRELVD
jgi:TetR/AcrR family transcriptional regulator, cholesterol catabolism regulator